MKLSQLIGLVLLTSISYSQTQDSIALSFLQKIKATTNDSVKINLELQLANRTRFFDIDTSRTIVNNVLETLKHKGSQSYYYKKQKAKALNYLGMFDWQQDKTDEALYHYFGALDICEAIQDSTGLGLTLHNLGMFYRTQKDYTKSKQYFRKAITIRESLKSVTDLAVSYHMLANTYYNNKQNDSSLIYINKVKALPISKRREATVNGTMAAIHYASGALDKAMGIYKENIAIFKAVNDQTELSISHSNTAFLYTALKDNDVALPHLDSAIFIAEKLKDRDLLVGQYSNRSSLYRKQKRYAEALDDYKIYKAYYDSINDTKKAKRITALELSHKFEKEKLADHLTIENEATMHKLYFLLFVLTVLMSVIILWLYRKNTKNKLEKEQLGKLRTELELLTQEKELKRAVVENSLRQEVLHNTLGRIKNIIKLEDSKKRKIELQSLFATLLSEKTEVDATSFQDYLNKVCRNFKVTLNTQFPQFTEKEKQILCFMTLDLNTTEISKLLNTTVSAIKSIRHRIRKKLSLDSNKDIIEFIANRNDDIDLKSRQVSGFR